MTIEDKKQRRRDYQKARYSDPEVRRRHKEYQKQYRIKNIERIRERDRNNRDPEKVRANQRKIYLKRKAMGLSLTPWRDKNPEKWAAYSKDYHLRHRLMRDYGLTIEQRDEMFKRNNGLCWVCSSRPSIFVDHDHDTGKVRGVLCLQCNAGIGHLGDDLGIVLKAAQYLKTHAPVFSNQ